MKLVTLGIIVAIVTFVFVVVAQTVSVSPAVALANCAAPTAGALLYCNVANDPANADGMYVSANKAPYFKVGASSGGVLSWNGRTGSVMPAANDYSYSQLSSPPTTISCTTAQQSNSGLTASGCTIK